MEKRRQNIDRSLKERYGIISLLERLRQNGVTLDEMEEIGGSLRKSGDRALIPLLRNLWRERDSDVISRYAYLLDFFDEEGWIDQLVQIALKRRDLDEEGKAVLLAALKGYGVDITAPPFARLVAEAGASLEVFTRVLDMGDEGLSLFVDDFICRSRSEQRELIEELGGTGNPRILDLLEVLLRFDDAEIVKHAATSLGKIKDPRAARILDAFYRHADDEVRGEVERSLRRLSFQGVSAQDAPIAEPGPFHAVFITPPDIDGCRSLWVSRWLDEQLATLYLHLHDHEGIKAAWGGAATSADTEARLRELVEQEGFVAISHEYALKLIRDAMELNRSGGFYLPADFYVLYPRLFPDEKLTPVAYSPCSSSQVWRDAVPAHRLAATSTILDDDYFSGWLMTTGRVYDYAEEWSRIEETGSRRGEAKLLEQFCRELLSPDLEQIRHRLLLMADLMREAGRETALIDCTIDAAASLPVPPLPCHVHPLLRRIALESIEVAREALAEGYDLRDQQGDDAEEWE
ncbi:HEAT repeat-containing protein [Geobacter sp. DSM 9736]|nr:HEAT repeat-containing protein [Geobacter sp. DSM 9736]